MSAEQLQVLNFILGLLPLPVGIILIWEGYQGLITVKKEARTVSWALLVLYCGMFISALRLAIYYGCLVFHLPVPRDLVLVGGLVSRAINAGTMFMFLCLQRRRNGKGV